MKWKETEASNCRYGDVARRIFEDSEIIFENSLADYQGFANVLAAMPDGSFIHYEWTYGSCSGCDEWEDRGLSDDEIEKEMRRGVAILENIQTLKKYCKLEDEFKEASVPTVNSPQNGSISGMMRFLGQGAFSDFEKMGKIVFGWIQKKEN
jgi:hypothetical protein